MVFLHWFFNDLTKLYDYHKIIIKKRLSYGWIFAIIIKKSLDVPSFEKLPEPVFRSRQYIYIDIYLYFYIYVYIYIYIYEMVLQTNAAVHL